MTITLEVTKLSQKIGLVSIQIRKYNYIAISYDESEISEYPFQIHFATHHDDNIMYLYFRPNEIISMCKQLKQFLESKIKHYNRYLDEYPELNWYSKAEQGGIEWDSDKRPTITMTVNQYGKSKELDLFENDVFRLVYELGNLIEVYQNYQGIKALSF